MSPQCQLLSYRLTRMMTPFVATAIDGQADVICTWDKHLFTPSIQQYLGQFGVRVLRDTELVGELRVP